MDSDKYVTEDQATVNQPVSLDQAAQPVEVAAPKKSRLILLWLVVGIAFAALLSAVILRVHQASKQSLAPKDNSAKVQEIKLSSVSPIAGQFKVDSSDRVVINGQLQANQGLVISPS